MPEYSFLRFTRRRNGDAFPDQPIQLTLSDRVSHALNDLANAYSHALPEAPPHRIGLVETPGMTGALSFWRRSLDPSKFPYFLIEIAPGASVDVHFEELLVHELAHPIIRLQGVPTCVAHAAVDQALSNELTSAIHHPYVFDQVDRWGYAVTQPALHDEAALLELATLRSSWVIAPTYTQPRGQTLLALWYFSFELMTPVRYQELLAYHDAHVPDLAQMMRSVSEAWQLSKREGADSPQRTLTFQRRLIDTLGLHDSVRLQSFEEWREWLLLGH